MGARAVTPANSTCLVAAAQRDLEDRNISGRRADFSFAHLRSIVFDQMLPRIAHYWTRSEVIRLMQDAGLEDVQIEWVNQMSWAARGKKPL